ncbi:HAD family hydrolase [Alicyclobacillus fastidiosus]|uniref:HAD family hydrolase n=1 Tax=Alicyclobacillus fastidiosus TaxID=392011 RepID=A0ABY6ZLA8_9BACL|nr:HAD family hydrolase [Alicyclobacillus fastidiosus]WAH43368.1 HAD family hydrolase [Alicyclobacillus fastidiosus]GMA65428.1 hydrolase [Alicyclobacillus fastidiosus]
MITHVIWDLGDTLITPPNGGQDLQPLDQCMEVQLRPGAQEILRKVSESGYVQAILSNTATSDSSTVRRLLNRLGVGGYFEFVYATQSELRDDKPEKPDPIVFDIVLDALGISPEQSVMIGNNWDADVLGANRSGMHACWLLNQSVSVRKHATSRIQSPPWVIPVWDIADVPDALQLLRSALTSPFNEATV